MPEKRFRIFLSENEIMDLPEYSKGIFKQNMIDRYIDCPNISSFGGKYSIIDSFCYAEFLRFYYVASNTKFTETDYQPEGLGNELIGDIHSIDHIYPKVIPLMSSKEKLKCRKVPHILQFYVPNQHTQPEEYSHYMLFMYYPFRSENDLKSGNPPTYSNKLRESNVIALVNQNHLKVEAFESFVNEVFERFNSELETNMDPFGQQENDETYDQQSQQLEVSDTDNCDADFTEIENQSRYADATSRQTPFFSDDMINEHIRSLN